MPPLLSKMTFCQRTNNSEDRDINDQNSLIESCLSGLKTPQHQNVREEEQQKQQAVTELSD